MLVVPATLRQEKLLGSKNCLNSIARRHLKRESQSRQIRQRPDLVMTSWKFILLSLSFPKVSRRLWNDPDSCISFMAFAITSLKYCLRRGQTKAHKTLSHFHKEMQKSQQLWGIWEQRRGQCCGMLSSSHGTAWHSGTLGSWDQDGTHPTWGHRVTRTAGQWNLIWGEGEIFFRGMATGEVLSQVITPN